MKKYALIIATCMMALAIGCTEKDKDAENRANQLNKEVNELKASLTNMTDERELTAGEYAKLKARSAEDVARLKANADSQNGRIAELSADNMRLNEDLMHASTVIEMLSKGLPGISDSSDEVITAIAYYAGVQFGALDKIARLAEDNDVQLFHNQPTQVGLIGSEKNIKIFWALVLKEQLMIHILPLDKLIASVTITQESEDDDEREYKFEPIEIDLNSDAARELLLSDTDKDYLSLFTGDDNCDSKLSSACLASLIKSQTKPLELKVRGQVLSGARGKGTDVATEGLASHLATEMVLSRDILLHLKSKIAEAAQKAARAGKNEIDEVRPHAKADRKVEALIANVTYELRGTISLTDRMAAIYRANADVVSDMMSRLYGFQFIDATTIGSTLLNRRSILSNTIVVPDSVTNTTDEYIRIYTDMERKLNDIK